MRLRDQMLHAVRKLAKAGDAAAVIALARYRLKKALTPYEDCPHYAALLRRVR